LPKNRPALDLSLQNHSEVRTNAHLDPSYHLSRDIEPADTQNDIKKIETIKPFPKNRRDPSFKEIFKKSEGYHHMDFLVFWGGWGGVFCFWVGWPPGFFFFLVWEGGVFVGGGISMEGVSFFAFVGGWPGGGGAGGEKANGRRWGGLGELGVLGSVGWGLVCLGCFVGVGWGGGVWREFWFFFFGVSHGFFAFGLVGWRL